jgi:hypothetical protein
VPLVREANDPATEAFIERVLAGLVPAIDYEADAAEIAAAEIRAPLSAADQAVADRLLAEHSTGLAEAARAAEAAREAARIAELTDWYAVHGGDS